MTKPLTWNAAEASCRALGSNLAIVRTPAENRAITAKLTGTEMLLVCTGILRIFPAGDGWTDRVLFTSTGTVENRGTIWEENLALLLGNMVSGTILGVKLGFPQFVRKVW